MESGQHVETRQARIYEDDLDLIHWKIRREMAARNVTLSVGQIIRELLEPIRQERAEHERAGNT